jgi:hypothetical protein
MSKETGKLEKLFTVRDQVQGFIDKLERLKVDGSIAGEQYENARREYDQRLNPVDLEIIQIKDILQKQLETIEKNIEICTFELDRLDTKFKVGELPEVRFQNQSEKMRQKIERLRHSAKELTGLIEAKSMGDLGRSNPERENPVPKQYSLHTVRITRDKLNRLFERTKTISSKLLSEMNSFAAARNIKLPGKSLLFVVAGVLVVLIIIVVLVTTSTRIIEIKVPINITGANNIGSLHFELIYDRETLTPISVQRGTLTGDALFSYSIDTPGDVIVGMVSSKGISGDGPLATIIFRTTGKGKANQVLSVENTAAYDSNSLQEIISSTISGSFKSGDNSFIPPSIQLGTR